VHGWSEDRQALLCMVTSKAVTSKYIGIYSSPPINVSVKKLLNLFTDVSFSVQQAVRSGALPGFCFHGGNKIDRYRGDPFKFRREIFHAES